MKRSRWRLLLAIPFAAGVAQAQDMKLGELLDKQAKPLSKAELDALMPGANVYNRGQQTERWWDNNPEGKVRAARGAGSFAHNRSFTGEGTWQVNDQGQYCVDLLWGNSKNSEKWCRFIFKAGDEYYGARSTTDREANAFKLVIKK